MELGQPAARRPEPIEILWPYYVGTLREPVKGRLCGNCGEMARRVGGVRFVPGGLQQSILCGF